MNPWLWLSAVVLVLDQASKYTAEAYLQLHQPVPLFPGFNLTLVYNPGAAFSFLSDAGGWQRWLFAGIAVIASVTIVIWMHRVPKHEWTTPPALAAILGGAIGNLWDRVAPSRGKVVDFFDFYWGTSHYPAFNIADAAIVGGVIVLCFTMIWPPAEDLPDGR